MPKNVETTIQLHSFYMLARLCSKSFKLGFSRTDTEKFQMYKLNLEKAEDGEGGRKGVEDEKHMHTHGGCMLMYGKTNTIL